MTEALKRALRHEQALNEQLAKETPAVKAFDSFLDPAELESMKK